MDLSAASAGKGWKLPLHALTLSYFVYFCFIHESPLFSFFPPILKLICLCELLSVGIQILGGAEHHQTPANSSQPTSRKCSDLGWRVNSGDLEIREGRNCSQLLGDLHRRKKWWAIKTHKGSFISGSSSTALFGSDLRSKYPKFPYEIKLFQLPLKCCHYVGNVFPKELVPI